jgi:DNA repair protein RecO (recombination protein O)
MREECRAIILRTLRYSEADLVVHALTDRGQRLNFIARSALKSKRRFSGGILEPSHCVRVSYKRPKSNNEEHLLHLNEAVLDQSFPGLRTDYQKLECALYFLKLISAVVKEGELEQPNLFNLLGYGLRAVENATDLSLLRMHFETKLLSQQGVLPPEPEFAALAEAPMSRHQDLHVSEDEKRRLKSRLDQVLKSYINL